MKLSQKQWASTIFVVQLVRFSTVTLTTAEVQSFEFFHETFVFGENERCNRNTTLPRFNVSGLKIPDLRVLEKFTLGQDEVNLKDFHQVSTRGIWAGYSGVNYMMTKNDGFGWSFLQIPGPECSFCWNNDETGTCDLNLRSLRYLGNPDSSLPGLSLLAGDGDITKDSMWIFPYGKETYLGHNGSRWNFEKRLCIAYWASTGPVDWTVYSGPNFTGPSACLSPLRFTNNESYGWGSLNYSYVGSVRRGCYRDGVKLNFDLETSMDSFYYSFGPSDNFNFSIGKSGLWNNNQERGMWEDLEDWLNSTWSDDIENLESCSHLWSKSPSVFTVGFNRNFFWLTSVFTIIFSRFSVF